MSILRFRMVAALIGGTILLSSLSISGAAESPRIITTPIWDTQADFDQCYRNRYLDSMSEPGSVQLASRILVSDEMGAGYNDFQEIQGKQQARKILPLDGATVRDAILFVDGSVSSCDIVVNGTVLGVQPQKKTYWDSNFESYVVPPALLKLGNNEFVFRARGEKGKGRIRVERSEQPNRSAVSRDGGATWDFDNLGADGYINGELGVRLSLGRIAPQAWIESPVLDLSQAAMREGIAHGTNGRIDAVNLDMLLPKGTSLQTFVRTGSTPDGYEENWGPWQPANSTQLARMQFERFAQWRIELKSSLGTVTPVVKRVSLRISSVPTPGTGRFKSLKVIEDANQRIVRSSYNFAYATHNGNSKILRDRWKLNEVVAGAGGEMEQFKALRQWVRNQWHNGWKKGDLNYIPSWDARIILTLAPKDLSLGMCTHYATTFVQCAQALGLPARSVFRGHALSEVWSNEHKKWIVMDAGLDPNDKRRATYHFEKNGVPLGELEAHKASHDPAQWAGVRVLPTNMSEGSAEVEPPFATLPLSPDFVAVAGNRPQFFMPLRNNFVDHREPEEPEHGEGYFKFLGHIYWKSPQTPDIRWTDFFTTREADINWTLNQAQLYLRQHTAQTDTIEVMLDTVTPNFSGYEVRIDGGDWMPWSAKSASAPLLKTARSYAARTTGTCIAFDWTLHAGRNIIEARPVNAAGLPGIISRMVVEAEAR